MFWPDLSEYAIVLQRRMDGSCVLRSLVDDNANLPEGIRDADPASVVGRYPAARIRWINATDTLFSEDRATPQWLFRIDNPDLDAIGVAPGASVPDGVFVMTRAGENEAALLGQPSSVVAVPASSIAIIGENANQTAVYGIPAWQYSSEIDFSDLVPEHRAASKVDEVVEAPPADDRPELVPESRTRAEIVGIEMAKLAGERGLDRQGDTPEQDVYVRPDNNAEMDFSSSAPTVDPEPVAVDASADTGRREDAGRFIPLARKHIAAYRGQIDRDSFGYQTVATSEDMKEIGQAFNIDKAWPVSNIKEAYRNGGDATGVALAVAARGAMYKNRNEIYPIRSRHNRYAGLNDVLVQSVNIFVDSMVVAERLNHQINNPDDRAAVFADIAQTDATTMAEWMINVPTGETIDTRWPERVEAAYSDDRFVDMPFGLMMNDEHLAKAKKYSGVTIDPRARVSPAVYLDVNARNSENLIDLSLIAEARDAAVSTGDILVGGSSRLKNEVERRVDWALYTIKRKINYIEKNHSPDSAPPVKDSLGFAYPISDSIENTVNSAAVALDRFVREHYPNIDASRLRPLSLRPSQENVASLIAETISDRLSIEDQIKAGKLKLVTESGSRIYSFSETHTRIENDAIQAIIDKSRKIARIQSEEIAGHLMTDLADACGRLESVAKEVGINIVDLMASPGTAVSQAEKKLKKNQPVEEVTTEEQPQTEDDIIKAMDFGIPAPEGIRMGAIPASVPGDVEFSRSGKIDWRGGANATEQMIMERFGITGIQYGNYVTQKQRGQMMNECYDALADLAYAMGVPDRFIGLNGLALAFGARGTGGKNAALAHYEPGLKVINFTRDKGRGTLAHEWGHALDNYIGVVGGSIMATDSLDSRGINPESVTAVCNFLKSVLKANDSNNDAFTKSQAEAAARMKFVRDQFMFESFDGLFRSSSSWMRVARSIAMVQEEKSGTEVDYHALRESLRGREAELVRSFYATMKPLLDEQYTVPRSFFRGKETARTVYYNRENLRDSLIADLTKRNMGNREPDDITLGMVRYFTDQLYPVLSAYWKASGAGRSKSDKNVVRKGGESDFAYSGRVIDERRSGDTYWSRNDEYFARAFSSVVRQVMVDEGVNNDWATAISTPAMFAGRDFIASPNIEGGELERAAQLFKSDLLPVIQSLAEQHCGERIVTEAERAAVTMSQRHEIVDSAQTGSLMTQ